MKYIKKIFEVEEWEPSNLFDAVTSCGVEEIMELIKAGADPNYKGSSGATPLLWAVFNKDTRVVKELLKAGADPNISNDMGNTPLIMAAYNNDMDIVMELLKYDVDWNYKQDESDISKDFYEYLNVRNKYLVRDAFPEKYRKYLARKKGKKYNLFK